MHHDLCTVTSHTDSHTIQTALSDSSLFLNLPHITDIKFIVKCECFRKYNFTAITHDADTYRCTFYACRPMGPAMHQNMIQLAIDKLKYSTLRQQKLVVKFHPRMSDILSKHFNAPIAVPADYHPTRNSRVFLTITIFPILPSVIFTLQQYNVVQDVILIICNLLRNTPTSSKN